MRGQNRPTVGHVAGYLQVCSSIFEINSKLALAVALIFNLNRMQWISTVYKSEKVKNREIILVVDDDDITNFLTQRILSRIKPTAQIIVATNGEEALRMIYSVAKKDHRCPDLILLDVNMPVMNGLEFLTSFSSTELRKSCRIVVVTTSNNKSDFAALKEYGIEEIISKPVTMSRMEEVLTSKD